MKTIGLTGGIGMGKSAAADLLAQRGCAVIDTDVLARQIVEPGQPALAEIQALLGPEVIDSDGQLSRAEVARRVFADERLRRELEGILHPRIRELWMKQTAEFRDAGKEVCVIVIPLLYETQAEVHFDAVICVACSPKTQRQRLRARGWSDLQIQQRLQAQWPIDKKMRQADFVVWTESTMEVHAEQLARILAKLGGA